MSIINKILKGNLGVGILLGVLAGIVPTHAMPIGAYTAPAIVSYANPETGEIKDGGGDEALGNSMCESVMQDDALIEYDGETTYVSLGIGLMSNISNIDIRVQTARGEDQYERVELIETGSYEVDGDTCVQYRFAMADPNLLISPSLFVDPMGREVQFFIRLDTSNLQAGVSNYSSEMLPDMEIEVALNEEEEKSEIIPEATPEVTPEATPTGVAVTVTETEAVTQTEVIPTVKEVETLPEQEKQSGYVVIIIVLLALAGIGGGILFIKREKTSEK